MGVTAAVVIGISAASAAYSSYAAKKAADQQTAAGEKALDLQEQMWNKQQSDLAPFVEDGKRMSASMNVAMGMGGGTPSYGPMATPPPMGLPPERTPVAPGQQQAQPLSTAMYAPQPQASQGFVVMQAPDGSKARVPQADVPKYKQQGATVVGYAMGNPQPTAQNTSSYRVQ